MTYEIHHQAAMLADSTRLSLYREALKRQVKSDDGVIDIGTGTGILASYAAQLTEEPVYGVEYFRRTADMARRLAERSKLANLRILNQASYDVTTPTAVRVLVSETIGALGPEENIVEIFWDFCRRHPSVRTRIPHTLSLFALPVRSPTLRRQFDGMLQSHFQASHDAYKYELIRAELEGELCARAYHLDAEDVQTAGKAQTLVQYDLGMTKESSFETDVNVEADGDVDAVHVYFVADLGEGLRLGSGFFNPMTHWKHSYVKRLAGHTQLHVSYSNRTRAFEFEWRK